MVKYRVIDLTNAGSCCPRCGLPLTSGRCMNSGCDNFDRYPRIFPMVGAIDNEGLSLEEGNDFV